MYLIDTHALILYITSGKLPQKVDVVFKSVESGKTILYIPTIVLAECLYLVEKGKIEFDFKELLEKIKFSDNFIVIPFDFDILEALQKVKKVDELHDRIIIASAKTLNLKVITKDETIAESGEVEVVW